jgi:2-oxoglutarate ferredoxin oxidoreductase subunit delta
MGEAAKKLPNIAIDPKRCKGCSICVDFCPTNVLEMRGPIVVVRDLDACTRCQLCDLRCPDFAIQVFD